METNKIIEKQISTLEKHNPEKVSLFKELIKNVPNYILLYVDSELKDLEYVIYKEHNKNEFARKTFELINSMKRFMEMYGNEKDPLYEKISKFQYNELFQEEYKNTTNCEVIVYPEGLSPKIMTFEFKNNFSESALINAQDIIKIMAKHEAPQSDEEHVSSKHCFKVPQSPEELAEAVNTIDYLKDEGNQGEDKDE